ncbi:hypothetical protein WBG99_06400 [Streptomyces sp. TG1A-60]|uniref:hypothetical protein n=1 Tax=Streptomyces sp. TG1A-60 TaxID=3129111 RepID=UPI0030CF804A
MDSTSTRPGLLAGQTAAPPASRTALLDTADGTAVESKGRRVRRAEISSGPG